MHYSTITLSNKNFVAYHVNLESANIVSLWSEAGLVRLCVVHLTAGIDAGLFPCFLHSFITRTGNYLVITMDGQIAIRRLVEKAIYLRRLTPEIEDEINYELTRTGYICDVGYEALELLMAEMDAGRIQLVASY